MTLQHRAHALGVKQEAVDIAEDFPPLASVSRPSTHHAKLPDSGLGRYHAGKAIRSVRQQAPAISQESIEDSREPILKHPGLQITSLEEYISSSTSASVKETKSQPSSWAKLFPPAAKAKSQEIPEHRKSYNTLADTDTKLDPSAERKDVVEEEVVYEVVEVIEEDGRSTEEPVLSDRKTAKVDPTTGRIVSLLPLPCPNVSASKVETEGIRIGV